jgi:hypothetical protein
MANQTASSTPRSTDTKPADPTGALYGIVSLAIDAGDKSSATALGLVQDVRGELRVAADAGIDAIENVVRGLFRFGKRATARVDELATELLGAGERTASGIFRGLRETARAAGDLATTATGAALAGQRPVAQA